MQAIHKPITRKSSPTYINAIPIAMNIINNATNIPTPPFLD